MCINCFNYSNDVNFLYFCQADGAIKEKFIKQFSLKLCQYNKNNLIIYIGDVDNPEILGYIRIKESSIANSKFFSIFCDNSIKTANSNPNVLTNYKAFQIVDWEFCEMLLTSERLLQDMFSKITVSLGEENNVVLLWCDYGNLIYYPIKNSCPIFPNLAAAQYFTNSFLKE